MIRRGLLPLVLLLGGAGIQPAQASGDFGCSVVWSLKQDGLDGCNNLPFLSPANDSRVNLRLLMADRGLQPLPDGPPSPYDREMGYGLVPFPLDRLLGPEEEAVPAGAPGGSDGDAAVVETPAAADPDAAALADLSRQIGLPPEAAKPPAADNTNLFASGEGSRCASNDDATARAFLQQLVGSTALSDGERRSLAQARLAMLGSCGGNHGLVPADVQSPLGRQFADYLRGAVAFYNGDFPQASEAFKALEGSEQPWLQETARYMAARTLLNQAQQNAFDEMGYPKLENVDRTVLAESEKAFEAYLQAYPNGLYAVSAQGLLRRIYWLGDDPTRLAAAYAGLLGQSPAEPDALDALVQETDNKLLVSGRSADVTDPTLLAVMDLMAMRDKGVDVAGDGGPIIGLDTLEQQKPRFADRPDLHAYLVAAYHFYVAQSPDETLKSLPDTVPAGPMSTLEFSRQTLRGFALEAKGDWAGAQALWLQLIPPATPLQRAQLELALAMNHERSGHLAAVFDAGSPIKSPEIRRILLRNLAGPALLRQQAKAVDVTEEERDTALFTLLYKDLMRGHYRDFGADLALLPDPLPEKPSVPWDQSLSLFRWDGASAESDYACPSIREIAATLQRDADSPQGLNCLGEFILRNGLDSYALDSQPGAEQLGGTATQFPGKVYSRLDGYMKVMADGKAGRNDRAYALYRAINCFAPSQNNGCGPQDIPQGQRKQWFQTLKSRYANTVWAKTLKYYW
ncbi:tetratricopeptide repeat protein [Inquilinus limosus]|uniref:tetratricopeptide repeat protein n=2 Tax=Bacteria TaxID=2 RepID=UPI000402738E|nr:hypothetical protein [Inquilinus limosus]